MDHYVVSAISEERNVPCDTTSNELTYACSIPPDSNVYDYNFSVHSVTSGVNGIIYVGRTATDCCENQSYMNITCSYMCISVMMHVGLPFPESVDAVEMECGVQPLIYVSWEVNI